MIDSLIFFNPLNVTNPIVAANTAILIKKKDKPNKTNILFLDNNLKMFKSIRIKSSKLSKRLKASRFL